MDSVHSKVVVLALIIASVIDFTLPSPILKHKVKPNERKLQHVLVAHQPRLTRQIVQPMWLNNGREPTIDPTVYVNEHSLSEAEEIRTTIKQAVEEGTFVVAGDDQDTNTSKKELSSTVAPNWYIQMEHLWHNLSRSLFKGFRN